MKPDRRVVVLGAGALFVARPAHGADELSGADKLRALYSAEFRFTPEGFPVVPVSIISGVDAVTISCTGGLRLLPEGEGGAEVRADSAWRIRATSSRPARLRHHAVVWRGRANQGSAAATEEAAWKARGESVQQFEQGALFGVAGEVIDRRERLVCVGPFSTTEEAERASARLSSGKPSKSTSATGGIYSELVERPHGRLEAVGGQSGARVVNEGVLWFVPAAEGPTQVEWQGGKRGEGRGSFHGRVYITFDRAGGLAVVNAVPEDRLLAGLVPAEMFPSAPDEALKAQAVAARNELLAKIGTRHVGDPFRLCSEVHCQVYAGAGRETARTTAAVNATRGEVLFSREGNELVDTTYSANCGGFTEDSGNVWPPTPLFLPLRGRRDVGDGRADAFAAGITAANVARFIDEAPAAHCASARVGATDRYRWTVTRNAAEAARLLEGLRIGALRGIEVLERGVSGRALSIRLTGAKATAVVSGELRIRQTFGGLRSSLFVAEASGGGITFRGGGFGHGVGMCQTGAVGMAEAGRTYKQILAHYYSGAAPRKLW